MSNITIEKEQKEEDHYNHNLPNKTPVFIVAVPRCHENLFQIIKDNHQWLAESESFKMNQKDQEITYNKRINTQEDLTKLEQIIQSLRNEKSELFIDESYHPKPSDMKIEDYIHEFLKNKSVGTHYTFTSFYRVTVLPDGAASLTTAATTPPSQLWEQRQEYLIVPLYIILKRGKTYEQMKTLSYNPDGSYNVNRVNPYHFYKMDDSSVSTRGEVIEEERKNRYDELLTSSS
jgi:hypothetical protein